MSPADFNELIDSLSKIKTVDGLHSACSALCEQFGFDRFLYGARLPTSFVKPRIISISGYPKEWRDRYTEAGYIAIDPTIIHCASNLLPIRWEQIVPQEKENEQVRCFMGEARGFGLQSGVSFAVHSPHGESAMLSLATQITHASARSHINNAMPFAQLFAIHLHENVRRILEHDIIPLKRVELTTREREVLLWTAEGKTTWETSRILNVSERTVVFHLSNASTKLKVSNRQQAVARAVSLGLINHQIG